MKRIIASLVGLLAASCSQPDAVTNIKEQFFSLSLPGHWTALPRTEEEGLFVYHSPEFSEYLTVSIFIATPRLSDSEAEDTLNKVVQARRDAEVSEDSAIVLMDTSIKRPGRGITAFYQGRSGVNRFVGSFTIVNSAGVANFRYEATQLPPHRFADRVLAVIGEVSFVE